MKLIIAGSREITEYELLSKIMVSYMIRKGCLIKEVVSGTAKGIDTLGERWAQENSIPVKRFPADWNRFGRAAGFKRNEVMGDYADEAVVIILNHSRGSEHMAQCMKTLGKRVSVCDVVIKDGKYRCSWR